MKNKFLALSLQLLVLPMLALFVSPDKVITQLAWLYSGSTSSDSPHSFSKQGIGRNDVSKVEDVALGSLPGGISPEGSNLTLPYSGTTSNISPAFMATNTGSGYGIFGQSDNNVGVYGYSKSAFGLIGNSDSSIGVYGYSKSSYAGYFQGSVAVTGNLTKGGGSFKIDHPLNPANKYLSHSFVESPDMMNIYNGNVILDANGEAWVQMPKWFEALNRDFRYQLTGIGAFAPVYIGQEMVGNRFKIAGGKPRMKVSWQVTGIRHDLYANAHRILVEENKPVAERGYYLHPELYSQPVQKNVAWAGAPEMMQRMQQQQQHLTTKNRPRGSGS